MIHEIKDVVELRARCAPDLHRKIKEAANEFDEVSERGDHSPIEKIIRAESGARTEIGHLTNQTRARLARV